MKKINLPQASMLTSPNPVSLVCTEKPDGSTNLATVSWWTYLSFNPGMIAYAMAKTSYSGEMVRDNKKVILTIPGKEIDDAVMGCGSTTGRDTDKASQFGIKLAEVEGSTIKIPVHSSVIRFCTSGGSGISGSMKGVKAAAKDPTVKMKKSLQDMAPECYLCISRFHGVILQG